MPTLDFKGKQFVHSHHLSVPFRELKVVPEKSLPAPDSKPSLDDNLIIHGDNLEALKALLPTHAGKVDCVFIDPPYNTGKEGWCYSDNLRSPLMQEWLKKAANPVDDQDLERHDKWLCMMWPRITLLRELLVDEGVICVCIGDDEVHRIRLLLDEVFGEKNHLATFCWKSRSKPSNSGKKKHRPQKEAEFIICYEKTAEKSTQEEVLNEEDRSYPHTTAEGRKFRISSALTSNLGEYKRETMRFPVNGYTPSGGQRWKFGVDERGELLSKNRIRFTEEGPQLVYYEDEETNAHAPFYCFVDERDSGTAELGKSQLNQVMGKGHGFDTVKPTNICDYIISRIASPSALILDSFGGSGTTAHAIVEANKRDGGKRRFILIECEDYAPTLTAERVRRVIKGYDYQGKKRDELLSKNITWTDFSKRQHKILEQVQAIENLHTHEYDSIKQEIKSGILTVTGERQIIETMPGLGGSFTYCELGEAIQIENLLSGEGMPSFESLARYVFYTVTGQALEQVAKPSGTGFIGETSLFRVHLLYQPDRDWLRSNDAALNAERVELIEKANTGKRCIVFGVAKFMGQKTLTAKRIEFCQLPYAVHRILGE